MFNIKALRYDLYPSTTSIQWGLRVENLFTRDPIPKLLIMTCALLPQYTFTSYKSSILMNYEPIPPRAGIMLTRVYIWNWYGISLDRFYLRSCETAKPAAQSARPMRSFDKLTFVGWSKNVACGHAMRWTRRYPRRMWLVVSIVNIDRNNATGIMSEEEIILENIWWRTVLAERYRLCQIILELRFWYGGKCYRYTCTLIIFNRFRALWCLTIDNKLNHVVPSNPFVV